MARPINSIGRRVRELRRRGKRARGESLGVWWLPDQDTSWVVVTPKMCGKAVVRNKIRRRLQHLLSDLNPPGETLVRAYGSTSSKTFAELHDELALLLDEAVAQDGSHSSD